MENILKRINEIKEKNSLESINLMILTPCYGGMVHIKYTLSLLHTVEFCKQIGINVFTDFTQDESLVQRARNNLICKTMNNPNNISHIIFIDADIVWSPLEILKLIFHDKELCGGIYPIKKHYFDVLESEDVMKDIKKRYEIPYNKEISYIDFLKENMLRFNLNFTSGTETVQDNLIPVRHVATGFMMMKRSCIEKMMEKYPETKCRSDTGFLSDKEQEIHYALFDCFIKDNQYFSEDWGFCERWTSIEGEIFADVTIKLGHIGTTEYNGRILSTLNLNA